MPPTYEDPRLLDRLTALRQLQREGQFLVNFFPQNHPSAIPGWPTAEELGLTFSSDPFARAAPWGKFTVDWHLEILIQSEGQPPPEYVPQIPLRPAVGLLYPASGFTRVVLAEHPEETLDLDLAPEDADFPARFLTQLNQALAGAGWIAWKLLWQEDLPEVIRVANDSALVWATSVLWDETEQQLVAAQVASPSQQLLKAIYATLVTNSRKVLSIRTQTASVAVFGARRRYTHVGGNLQAAHARGHLLALEHPLSGNPAENAEDFFYVVGLTGEDLPRKFLARLDLAIPWPVQPQWADALLQAGQAAGLVEPLSQAGPDNTPDAPEYAIGLRVAKDPTGWQAVIATALQTGEISL